MLYNVLINYIKIKEVTELTLKLNSFEDQSTTEVFKFIIRCEQCGKVVKTYQSTSSACYKHKFFQSPSERKAKELLWLKGHEEALESATTEAFRELNRCEICGAFVCNDCSETTDELDGGVACKRCVKQRALISKQG